MAALRGHDPAPPLMKIKKLRHRERANIGAILYLRDETQPLVDKPGDPDKGIPPDPEHGRFPYMLDEVTSERVWIAYLGLDSDEAKQEQYETRARIQNEAAA